MTNLKKGVALFLAVIMMLSSLSVVGFADNTKADYTVETYIMDINGKYPSDPESVSVLQGNIGEQIYLSGAPIEGFTVDTAKSLLDFTILADSSSVGKIYYSRNKYKATYYYEDFLGAQTEYSYAYYGAEIPSFEANPGGYPALQGYNFIGWSLDENENVPVPQTMPANDIDMYALYDAKTFTYTFDAGEFGSFPNGERFLTFEYEYGDVPEQPDEYPSMPHFEFVCWDNDVPAYVSEDMYFTATYNECVYSVIFYDGDEIIDYIDGYYYGDILEEIDLPESYEAWTFSDGSYVEFPYTIKGNTILFAADSPSYYTARFYLDYTDTEPYDEFSVLQGDDIMFPDAPEKTGYSFCGWSPEIYIMPDEDTDFVAIWEVNTYTVDFDLNGGVGIDDPVEVEYGEQIILPPIPQKDGYVFAGWEGLPEGNLMPAENITLIAKWEEKAPEVALSFKTEIYTFDEATGEWVVANEVERGEKVKARVFIDTDFAVGSGQVLCFYDDNVFTMDSSVANPLLLNNSPTSSAKINRAKGKYHTLAKTSSIIEEQVYFGYVSEEFIKDHSAITFTFDFSTFKCHSISGDEWFAEFDLTAKEDAAGVGDFLILPETIANDNERTWAYITLSKGYEGQNAQDAMGMFNWDPTTSVESNPVSTGYGKIILDSDGGIFSSNSSDILVIDAKAGDDITLEYPEKAGYNFFNWDSDSIPLNMPEDVLTFKALWTPSINNRFTVVAHYYDFADGGAGVYSHKEFEYVAATDSIVKIVENIPANPDDNTNYVLLSDIEFAYNVFDEEDINNTLSATVAADGSTVLDLYFTPVNHIVIFDAAEGMFVDGEKVKYVEAPHGSLASDYIPQVDLMCSASNFNGWYGLGDSTRITADVTFSAYWTLVKNTVTWIIDSDNILTTEVEYGSVIASPVTPEKEGHVFVGWFDNTGTPLNDSYRMPANDVTFEAAWAINNYPVVFDAGEGRFDNGSEKITLYLAYGSEITEPDSQPVREGYEFVGWDKDINTTVPANLMTFTAVWEKIIGKYTVTFEANGGSFDDNTSVYVIESEEGEPVIVDVICTREGYIFDGWYFENTRVDSVFNMPSEDIILEAKWIEIPTEPTTVPTTEPTTAETTTQPTTTEPTTASTTIPTTQPTTTEPTTVETTTQPTTVPTTAPTTESTTKTPVTEPTTVPTTVHVHSPKTVVVNADCNTAGESYQVCNDCGQKLGESTVIPALGHNAGDWETVTQPTYDKEGKKVKKCTRCATVLEEASIPVLQPQTVDLKIKTPSRTTIKYGDSIYLHAIVELPVGAKVVWEANNSNFSTTPSADGKTLLITPASKGDTEFTAKVVDSKGNVISEICTQKMTSKAGFFQKIIAFFKKLFGMTKVYPEFIYNVYDK